VQDAKAESRLGFTFADPHDAVHSYRKAEHMQKEATRRSEKHAAWLRNEESARQDTERKMLNRSLSVILDDFKEEWKQKKKVMEAQCEKLWESSRERAEAQKIHLEKKYEMERIPPVKYSTVTRDLIKQGKKLADAEYFEDVIVIHNRLDAGKRKEEEQWVQNIKDRQATGRAHLEEKLAQEAASTEERVSGLRAAYEKQHALAKDVLMQRCKNLTHDMDAAFKREWFQTPEVAKSAKYSNKSRIHRSATFYGSLLQDKMLGGSLDIPSVCGMQFGDEELTGTKADYDAVHAWDVYEGPKSPPKPHFVTPKKQSKAPLTAKNDSKSGQSEEKMPSVGIQVHAE
jgi:hypothetical protein